MSKPAVLVVEDDDLQYEVYEDALSDYTLMRATTGREALEILSRHPVKVILLDHILAEGDLGLDFLPDLKELLPHVPVVIVSGALEVHEQLEALQGPRGADFCITKPVDVDELARTVRIASEECGESEVIRRFESLERSLRQNVEALMSRSTDRLSRQKLLQNRLKDSQERPNISRLAREFNVARRTIIRDISELIRRGQLDPKIFPKWSHEKEASDED